jgi:hypothetical protein
MGQNDIEERTEVLKWAENLLKSLKSANKDIQTFEQRIDLDYLLVKEAVEIRNWLSGTRDQIGILLKKMDKKGLGGDLH